MKWRVVEPCPALHPDVAAECEKGAGHNGDHYYLEWEIELVSGEAYPSYPVYWSTEVETA